MTLTEDTSYKIKQGKIVIGQLNSVLWGHETTRINKEMSFSTVLESILTCGSATLQINHRNSPNSGGALLEKTLWSARAPTHWKKQRIRGQTYIDKTILNTIN